MASGHTGRALAYFGSIDKGGDHAVDSPRSWFSRRTYRQALNAKQKAESTTSDISKDLTPSWAAVIGQWICFVLGGVCIVYGVFGIFAKRLQDSPSASVAWLGSAYVPTLRVTALLCFFMGLLLVRHGWSSPDHEQKKERR